MSFELYGITEQLLDSLSYESTELLKGVGFSYRVKSLQSCMLKYNKCYPSIEVNKCYNDLLGIRVIVSDYNEILRQNLGIFKVADMRNGKVKDDGYRGMHLYYQKSDRHYPIEIQINSKRDRKINDWVHIHLYKHLKDNNVGIYLREQYDSNVIGNEDEFKEALKDVLSSSKEV